MLKLFQKLPVSMQQFIKFGIIGGFNTVLSYLILNGCYYGLHFHEQLSNFVNYVITVFISYVLNSKFVFHKDKAEASNQPEIASSFDANQGETEVDKATTGERASDVEENTEEEQPWYMALLKVYASYAFTELVVMGFLLYLQERVFGIPHFIATITNLVVTVPLNFILNKFWAYRNRE